MKNNVINLAKNLISIPSIKDSVKDLQKALDTAKSVLPDYPDKSFVCDNTPSLLIYNQWPEKGKFKIILNAHLDVVPGKPEQFIAKIDGSRLIGRGAIDMKAAAAVEILAFKEVAKKVQYPLGLQLVTDEETGGHDCTGYQIAQGILTDFYLCGEYSDLGIGNQTKGVLWLKITTHGKRAHGAFLWNGVNAITKLNRELEKIILLFPVPNRPAWITTCNVSIVEGGKTVNQVPDTASATLDIRRVPEDKASDIVRKITSNKLFRDTNIEIITNEPTNFSDPKNHYLKSLSQIIREHTGRPAKFIKFHGASDARHYSQAGACAIDFGPTGEGLHSDSEWVDLKSLENYYQILVKFLLAQ